VGGKAEIGKAERGKRKVKKKCGVRKNAKKISAAKRHKRGAKMKMDDRNNGMNDSPFATFFRLFAAQSISAFYFQLS
jgi:hypothetical protein